MCFMYVVHCSLYVQHRHCNCVFTLAGPAHLARISRIMTRQTKTCVNVVNNDKGSSIKDVRKEGGGGSREKGHVRT